MKMGLVQLDSLSLDERWNLIKSNVKRVNIDQQCKPNYIGPLYWNYPDILKNLKSYL